MNVQIKERLEYLRGELRAERLSYGELAELQSLANFIEPDDVELLEAAGVPEHIEYSSEKIVILDFELGKVYTYPVPMHLLEADADEVLEYWSNRFHFRTSNCQYMLVNSDDFIEWEVQDNE